MAMSLVPGLTHESVGFYAGVLSSSFMVGRAFSSYPWGKIADIYGCKFVVIVSLLYSAVFHWPLDYCPPFHGCGVAISHGFGEWNHADCSHLSLRTGERSS